MKSKGKHPTFEYEATQLKEAVKELEMKKIEWQKKRKQGQRGKEQ